MARKAQHFTDYTADEIDVCFSAAIAQLGLRMADPNRDACISAVPVDDVPLGSRHAEQRKPGSVFYSTGFLEARATAAMLVDLGLDRNGAQIFRRDAPDTHVVFPDGQSFYVEHAMVMDEAAMRLSVLVDDANILAERHAQSDEHARSIFEGGSYIIRLDSLTDERLNLQIRPEALALEIVALARTIQGPLPLTRTDPAQVPILSALGATVYYKPGNAKTARPIMLPMFHGRRRLLEPMLHQTLQQKIAKARRFDPQCSPLWLLLDVDLHFDAAPYLRAVAGAVMERFAIAPYDRVVIQTPRCAPLIFEQG